MIVSLSYDAFQELVFDSIRFGLSSELTKDWDSLLKKAKEAKEDKGLGKIVNDFTGTIAVTTASISNALYDELYS